MPRLRSLASAITSISICVGLLGCQAKTTRYHLRGKVISTNASAGEVTVDHEEIPGFMPAMIMPYKVKPPDVLATLSPGDTITAEVAMSSARDQYWLGNVAITAKAPPQQSDSAPFTSMLRPGERPPDIALLNQDSKTRRFSDFKGKALLIGFIYTRCPMPEFCPRLSTQFATVHENLAKTPDIYARTQLLTISFDPKFDTAPVLRKYGLQHLEGDPSGFAHWEFVTAKPPALKKLADAFGVRYFPEKDQIIHSLNIVLLAPDGAIERYWGQEFSTAELEEALREQAEIVTRSQSHK